MKLAINFILLFTLVSNIVFGQNEKPPFSITPELFDTAQSNTLGLSFAPDLKTTTIFKPKKKDNHYNHGVVLYAFKNELYAQWQSSKNDEDAPETIIYYAKSKNGIKWSKPKALLPANKEEGIITNGGWWSHGDTLVAYICKWSKHGVKPKQGTTEYITSADGETWSSSQPILDNEGNAVLGIIEQDLHSLPDGRIITAVHEQPGLILKPYFTDNPNGVHGWTRAELQNLPHKKSMSRELEPSWYYRADSAVVMVFRDQKSSFKKYGSVSYDRGETYTLPAPTNVPDSRAKQSAGNLPNGTAYQINNPSGKKKRIPLVIITSKDGLTFDQAYLIRSGGKDLQKMRYQGKYKRIGYSYPKSYVWNNYLYVSYATNKEDVEISRIPIKAIER